VDPAIYTAVKLVQSDVETETEKASIIEEINKDNKKAFKIEKSTTGIADDDSKNLEIYISMVFFSIL
jgi:hypothetical protein